MNFIFAALASDTILLVVLCSRTHIFNFFDDMINNILLVLSLSGSALGVVVCCLLLFQNKKCKHTNRLLATTFFCIITILLVTFLFVWNIDVYAYIYRFPSPLVYLLLPVSYLYIRTVVNSETHLNRRDVIHFLLPLFYFIEILPHYFSSYAYRRNLVRELVSHPYKFIDLKEGVLPSLYHIVLLTLQAVVYIILIVLLLRKANRLKHYLYADKANSLRWVKTLTFLIGVNFLPMLCFFLCPPSLLNNALQFILVVLTLSFLSISVYLFTKPEILYGISNPTIAFPDTKPVLSVSNGYDFEIDEDQLPANNACEMTEKKWEFSNLERYRPLLENYMQSEKPFLKQGYSINALSKETGIPQHHLSAMINRVYEMRFNEYLNRLRIDYISENFKNPEWENLTLEGIAKQAGFTSRTTFFNTIKKITGLSPSEYIAQIKQNK